jgi:hypothetical protein
MPVLGGGGREVVGGGRSVFGGGRSLLGGGGRSPLGGGGRLASARGRWFLVGELTGVSDWGGTGVLAGKVLAGGGGYVLGGGRGLSTGGRTTAPLSGVGGSARAAARLAKTRVEMTFSCILFVSL